MKTNLENFYDDLKREMAEEVLMPFVCNGNPLDAEVLIIGFNPTTEYDFWKFFTNKKGFDHVAELEDYIYHRALKNKKTKLSNTRGRIKRLEDILWKKYPDLHILKMNLYAKATLNEAELLEEDRNLKIFNFLIRNLRPKLIITHGKSASSQINSLDLNDKLYSHLKAVPKLSVLHFSRLSYKEVSEIAEDVSFKIIRDESEDGSRLVTILSASDATFPELLKQSRVALGNDPRESEIKRKFYGEQKNRLAKSSKDYSKYFFNGQEYNKRNLVLAVVQYHVSKRKINSFTELAIDFPASLKNGRFYKKIGQIKNIDRYFSKVDEVFNFADGCYAISNRWTVESINDFIDQARSLNYDITLK
jgi:hypothetical protein